MILARVVGKAVSTIKHASLNGARLLICEPIGAASNDPVLAMDELGAHAGNVVVLSSDGIGAREMVHDENVAGPLVDNVLVRRRTVGAQLHSIECILET